MRKLTLFAILFLATASARASCGGSVPNQTSTPDSASFATCWNNAMAASGNQTITISAGAATWSSLPSLNSVTGSQSVTVIGATNVTFSGTAGQPGSAFSSYTATWGDNAGACSSVGTCITFSVCPGIEITNTGTGLVTFENFTFASTCAGSVETGVFIYAGSHGVVGFHGFNWHVYMYPGGNFFEGYNGYGVLDHWECDDTSTGGGECHSVGGDFSSSGYLNWQDSTQLGSNQQWIVENMIEKFSGTGSTNAVMDSVFGGKFTFRFSNVQFNGGCLSGLGWGHGTDSGGFRGTVQQEIYGNLFDNETGGACPSGNMRGGTFLYWGNKYIAGAGASWSSGVDLSYFRCNGQSHSSDWGLTCGTWESTPYPALNLAWVPVSATITNASAVLATLNASNWQASHSYTCSTSAPCEICPSANNAGGYNFIATSNGTSSGTEPSWSQTFPPVSGTADGGLTWYNVGGVCTASPNPGVSYGFLPADPDDTGTTSSYTVAMDGLTGTKGTYPFRDQPGRGGQQTLLPAYEFINGGAALPSGSIFSTDAGTTNAVVQNRDYYDYVASGFTGATGVGSGALASAPGTCTQGVGYFATDQGSWNVSGNGFGSGVLYQCGASNNFTTYYTPYQYPDPLEGVTQGTPSAGLLLARNSTIN